MTDRESQGCGNAAPFFISNFRKIFPKQGIFELDTTDIYGYNWP